MLKISNHNEMTSKDFFDAEEKLPYLLFSIGNNIYGISCEFIEYIDQLKSCLPVIDFPPTIRGCVMHNNEFINLLDLRKLFGMDTQLDECLKLINVEQRIRDHENWVNTLEQSVIDEKPFILTNDPTKCAFGKWFYSFQKTNNNMVLKHELNRLEKPHSGVHHTAVMVEKLIKENKHDEAMKAIKTLRETDFKTTMNLFSQLKELLAEHLTEIYIVIKLADGTLIGIIADEIIGLEHLQEVNKASTTSHSEYLEAISKREKSEAGKDYAFILDINKLKS